MRDDFRVIAHRGASASAPENTLEAFQLALDQGTSEIELDVRFSSDAEIMVFHDERLDAKTSLEGRFRHYDAATLLRTDIGTWFDETHSNVGRSFAGVCLTTLEAVLAELGDRARYHIEIKDSDDLLPLRLLQQVDRHRLFDRVTVTSFSMRPLLAVRKLAPEMPICFLLRDQHDALRSAEFRPELEGGAPADVQAYWIERAAEAGFEQIGVRAREVTPSCLAHAADRGLTVRGWGIDSEGILRHLLRVGAAGATVDWPGPALEIVATFAADA